MDDVGFKKFYAQNEDIEGVAMMNLIFIVGVSRRDVWRRQQKLIRS